MRHSPYYVATVATANGKARKWIQARVKEFNGGHGDLRLRTKLGPRKAGMEWSSFTRHCYKVCLCRYQNIKPWHAGAFDVYVYVDWESCRNTSWETNRLMIARCHNFVEECRYELGLTD